MNAVCPACGVAVVPGYVRCPRCHAGLLHATARSQRPTGDPGGTAMAARGFPISAVLVAVGVAAAIIAIFGLRGGTRRGSAAPAALPGPVAVVGEAPAAGAATAQPALVPAATPAAESELQDRSAAMRVLEDVLHRQRLWGRAEASGPRVDVRSGSCADPAMQPAIEGQRAVLHGAGLTKLRCLEQSGAVVFERDL